MIRAFECLFLVGVFDLAGDLDLDLMKLVFCARRVGERREAERDRFKPETLHSGLKMQSKDKCTQTPRMCSK